MPVQRLDIRWLLGANWRYDNWTCNSKIFTKRFWRSWRQIVEHIGLLCLSRVYNLYLYKGEIICRYKACRQV